MIKAMLQFKIPYALMSGWQCWSAADQYFERLSIVDRWRDNVEKRTVVRVRTRHWNEFFFLIEKIGTYISVHPMKLFLIRHGETVDNVAQL